MRSAFNAAGHDLRRTFITLPQNRQAELVEIVGREPRMITLADGCRAAAAGYTQMRACGSRPSAYGVSAIARGGGKIRDLRIRSTRPSSHEGSVAQHAVLLELAAVDPTGHSQQEEPLGLWAA
jgi:hypothetical protein